MSTLEKVVRFLVLMAIESAIESAVCPADRRAPAMFLPDVPQTRDVAPRRFNRQVVVRGAFGAGGSDTRSEELARRGAICIWRDPRPPALRWGNLKVGCLDDDVTRESISMAALASCTYFNTACARASQHQSERPVLLIVRIGIQNSQFCAVATGNLTPTCPRAASAGTRTAREPSRRSIGGP